VHRCRLCLPPELERELTVIEFTLPVKAELGRVLDGIIESAQLPALAEQGRDTALDADCGLIQSPFGHSDRRGHRWPGRPGPCRSPQKPSAPAPPLAWAG